MELNYWSALRRQIRQLWDEAKKEWTVVVERDGEEVVLRPKQLVLCDRHVGQGEHGPHFKGQRASSRASSTIRLDPSGSG
jgi:putative flavoprotein involved in K+ transport